MKQILTALFLFSVSLSGLAQSRQTILLKPLNESAIVLYINETYAIAFRKQDLKDEFTNSQQSNWFLNKSTEEKLAVKRAIGLLDGSNAMLPLLANDPLAPAPRRALALLIRENLGAGLISHGKVEVYDQNKKRRDTIETINNTHFYFRNSDSAFFVSEK